MVGILVGAVLAGVVLYYATYDMRTLEEVKVCTANIQKTDIEPQLREYLKERLYWNAAVWMRNRRDFFTGSQQLDFGPVDTKVLGNARGIKDSSSSLEVYEAALKKFGMQRKPQPPSPADVQKAAPEK